MKRVTTRNRLSSIIVVILMIVSMQLMAFETVFANGSPIIMTKTSLEINIDVSTMIYLSGESVDAVSWESSNTNAAIIESSTTRKATIKGVGNGTADIIATDLNGNKAICKVNVLSPMFSITKQMLMAVEKEKTIEVLEGSAVKWESSNNDIVSIKNGKATSAVIKAESIGTAVVTATDKYGTQCECNVRVRQEDFEIYLYTPEISNSFGSEEADFSYYWNSYHQDGWWDADYNYHDSYDGYESLSYYAIVASEGNISKCVSSNTKVVTVGKTDGNYCIFPKGVGSAVVTVYDPYGEIETIKCSVSFNYFLEQEAGYPDEQSGFIKKTYSYNNLKYGDSYLKGITYSNAKVTAIISGKTYTGNADSDGYYSVKVPKYLKINTSIRIKTSQYGVTKAYTRKVVNNKPGITLSLAKNSRKKVLLTLKNVHSGDYLKLKVGKRIYTRTVKKDSKKIVYKIKTKKIKKGKKVTVTIFNKHKQKLNNKTRKFK